MRSITGMKIWQPARRFGKSVNLGQRPLPPGLSSFVLLIFILAASTAALAATATISGTVFEDVNYGGGAGRSLASGVVRPNVRVEIYNAAGTFLSATTTNASGVYTFTETTGQTYTIRVVNSSVTSSRTGAIGSLISVQTFRTSGLSGNVGVADTNRVGGEDPTKIDAGNGTTTLAALTTGTNTPQSITSVALGAGNVTGIDFGFNFDTIVSTRDSGQGTLRQFITNSNALGNAGLAQAGQTAGVETSIFMISSGSATPGLRAGLTNQLTGGVAQIIVVSQLPAITDANTAIDATLQTTNVGDTNPGTLGVGGTVGVDGLALPTVNRPEVLLNATRNTIVIGIQIQANNATVRGMNIYGFGTASNSNGNANIEIENGITGTLIDQNILGTTATSFTDPGAGTRSLGDNIRSVGAANGTVQHNLIGFSEGKGFGVENGSTGWLVQQNEIRGNGINNPNLDGTDVENSSLATIKGNLYIAGQSTGIDSFQSTGSNTIINNTVTGNGLGSGGALENMGIRIYGANNTVTKNIVFSNAGAGIFVNSGASSSTISQNSIFLNGTIGTPTHEIGIDLMTTTDNASLGTSPFVTLNHAGGGGTGGNGLLNFPIIQTATINNGQLTLTGFARPGSLIEFFIANPDPSGFGQGQTFLVSLTEGSAADQDATTGTYGPGAINGIAQGTDTTNKYKFVIPIPAGVSVGTVLTATATLANATSEFSGNVTVGFGVTSVSGKVYVDTNHNGSPDSGEDWTGGTSVFVNLVKAGVVTQTVTVPAGAGTFTFNNVTSGAYSIVVTNSAAATTAVVPAGFAFVNPTNGTLQINAANDSINNQNFGLFHGSLVSGTVFKDNGAGGGAANDGILNGAESGIPSVTVKATNGGATTFDTEQTASDGTYTLFIAPGATTVAIIETNPANYVSTGASVGTTGGVGGVYNRATDTLTFTKSGEAIFTGVNFGDVPQNTFQNNGAQQGLPNSVLFYPHVFDPGTAGSAAFSFVSTASPNNLVLGHIIYQDTNCNGSLDPGEPVITGAVATVAGTNLCIIMKVTIPSGAPFNATDSTVITANFTYTNANPALSAAYTLADSTTVGTGTNAGLELDKAVDKASALPGANLTYIITYTNNSTSPLSNLKINDSTPAYTTFVSASCGSPLPNNLTACSITSPAVGATGAIQWTFTGTLAPSQSSTVTFIVKIQ